MASLLTQLVDQVLTPLCDSTAELMSPIHLAPNDRMMIDLVDDGRYFLCKPYALVNGEKRIASHNARIAWAVRVPERKEQSPGEWRVAATDFTALLIHSLWPKDRLEFTEDAETYYNFLLLRFFKQTVNSKLKAEYKVNGVVPSAPEGFIDHPEFPLSPYQRTALFTQLDQDAALFMEQGTGKTPIMIRRICHEAHMLQRTEKRMYRALICCPKNVRLNWQNEIHKFATVPGRVAIVRGGRLTRIKLLVDAMRPDPNDDSEFVAVIASFEMAKKIWPLLKTTDWDWDLCVLDESHSIKNPRTDRAKVFMQIRDKSKHRVVLTGTPITGNLADLQPQLEFLGEGLSGFSSFDAYRKFYGRYYKEKGQRYEKFLGVQNLPFMRERLARLAFMVTKKEALPNLPEKVYDVIECSMSPKQAKIYSEVANTLIAEIESGLETKTLTAQHALVKLLRLAQIAAGFIKFDGEYDDDGNLIKSGEIEQITPNPKLDELVSILKDKEPTDKTIVWASFVPAIHAISDRLTKEGIKHVTYFGGTSDADREAAERAFNEDPECKVFIGNPAAGGVGINLWGYVPAWEGTEKDHGCNCTHEIYFAQNWSYTHRAQSEDRAHRRGTRTNVRISDLIVPGTIDEEIRNRVLLKKTTAYEIQDIREILLAVTSLNPDEGDE